MQGSGFVGIRWLGEHPYAYPLLEVAHLVGLALLVGNLVLVELRVWGRGGDLAAESLGRLALSVAVAGFGLVAASGVLLFAAAPAELLAKRVFVVKMGLVMLAGLNAGWFHARGGMRLLDRTAKAQTALSLGLWLAVIICGRWIGYS